MSDVNTRLYDFIMSSPPAGSIKGRIRAYQKIENNIRRNAFAIPIKKSLNTGIPFVVIDNLSPDETLYSTMRIPTNTPNNQSQGETTRALGIPSYVYSSKSNLIQSGLAVLPEVAAVAAAAAAIAFSAGTLTPVVAAVFTALSVGAAASLGYSIQNALLDNAGVTPVDPDSIDSYSRSNSDIEANVHVRFAGSSAYGAFRRGKGSNQFASIDFYKVPGIPDAINVVKVLDLNDPNTTPLRNLVKKSKDGKLITTELDGFIDEFLSKLLGELLSNSYQGRFLNAVNYTLAGKSGFDKGFNKFDEDGNPLILLPKIQDEIDLAQFLVETQTDKDRRIRSEITRKSLLYEKSLLEQFQKRMKGFMNTVAIQGSVQSNISAKTNFGVFASYFTATMKELASRWKDVGGKSKKSSLKEEKDDEAIPTTVITENLSDQETKTNALIADNQILRKGFQKEANSPFKHDDYTKIMGVLDILRDEFPEQHNEEEINNVGKNDSTTEYDDEIVCLKALSKLSLPDINKLLIEAQLRIKINTDLAIQLIQKIKGIELSASFRMISLAVGFEGISIGLLKAFTIGNVNVDFPDIDWSKIIADIKVNLDKLIFLDIGRLSAMFDLTIGTIQFFKTSIFSLLKEINLTYEGLKGINWPGLDIDGQFCVNLGELKRILEKPKELSKRISKVQRDATSTINRLEEMTDEVKDLFDQNARLRDITQTIERQFASLQQKGFDYVETGIDTAKQKSSEAMSTLSEAQENATKQVTGKLKLN